MTALASPPKPPSDVPLGPERDPSLAHLLVCLGDLEAQVRDLVARRRAEDPTPDDAFRGLYLADEHVDRLLDAPAAAEMPALHVVAGGHVSEVEPAQSRLARLAPAFGLTSLDLHVLLVALAPDLDPRFEKLYGYLHDDVVRRRASPGLALELAGCSGIDVRARERFSAEAPLRAGALLLVEEGERPFLTRSLRVPDRVAAHLLGGDEPDAELAASLWQPLPWVDSSSTLLARAFRHGHRLAYVRESGSATAVPEAAAGLLSATGRPALVLDLAWTSAEDADRLARLALREARLGSCGLIVGPIDAVPAPIVAAVTTSRADAGAVPLVLIGGIPWDPAWSDHVPLVLEARELRQAELRTVWRDALGASAQVLPEAVAAFRLGPESVHKAVASAQASALAEGAPVEGRHLLAGARLQNGTGLARLARHLVPASGWDDLVVPDDTRQGLEHLVARVTHRDRVLDDWQLRRSAGRGEAVLAMFAGESGTGKTMAAEVVAGALGLEVYVLDLSSVVDKYIGETEKNLERIFTEAAGVNAVLFFDEADALFGKRSEVSDARDRYANLETSYLLQRLESFDGLAILATNLRSNLDEAFARRLSMVVDFGRPDVEQRRQLWHKSLAGMPLGADVDIEYFAQTFDLAGGDIRSVAVTAAYAAAARHEAEDQVVDMRGLIIAVGLEYRKLGRLCLEAEFGPYYSLLTAPNRSAL